MDRGGGFVKREKREETKKHVCLRSGVIVSCTARLAENPIRPRQQGSLVSSTSITQPFPIIRIGLP